MADRLQTKGMQWMALSANRELTSHVQGDSEVISQNLVSSIRSCDIQNIQFRKPGAAVPTLIVTFEVDAVADKMRKRRSSRSGQLTSASSTFPNSLLFRNIPEQRFSVYDWQVTIQPRIQPSGSDFGETISSDAAPTFNSFSNPFSKNSDRSKLPKPFSRPEIYHRHSQAKDAHTRDRPNTSNLISPSPSLRSRRSDISSRASSFSHPLAYSTTLPIQQLPPDLPSPASTLGYEDQFISGWTSAQGRSSALSNHTRASASVSMAGGTPPAPRETILDRAFMLRVIPGSDRAAPAAADDDPAAKLSSIARFEALMREHDERRLAQHAPSARPMTDHRRKDSISGWELEEESAESDSDDFAPAASAPAPAPAPARRRPDLGRHHSAQPHAQTYYDDDDDDDGDGLGLGIHTIPQSAQRALEYITNRNPPRPRSARSARHPPPPPLPLPPHNATLPRARARPMSLSLGPMNAPGGDDGGRSPRRCSKPPPQPQPQQQQQQQPHKRLSCAEFARRLSSSSSLLLVQTNASGSGASSARHSRGSVASSEGSAGEEAVAGVVPRGLGQARLSGMGGQLGGHGGQLQAPPVRLARGGGEEKGCGAGWRGSGLGVFGGEGGFL